LVAAEAMLKPGACGLGFLQLLQPGDFVEVNLASAGKQSFWRTHNLV
jgi:hypothetical protein